MRAPLMDTHTSLPNTNSSRAKEARQAQLILGEALEKFSVCPEPEDVQAQI